MIILFILGLILGGVAVVFALQNIAVVTVSFFSWSIEGSLAVVLLTSIVSGILICLLIVLPGAIQATFRARKFRKEIARLEEELKKQKELTVFAKHDAPTLGDIERIEQSAISHRE